MNKRLFIYSLVTLMLSFGENALAQNKLPENSTSQPNTVNRDERQAIQTLRSAFVDAYNAGKADAIAATFTEDGRITDEEGNSIEGRKAVAERYIDTFKDNPGAKIELRSSMLRMLSPDVAIEEGTATVRDAEKPTIADATKQTTAPRQPAAAPQQSGTPYTAIFVKKDGRWLVSMLRDQAASGTAEPTPHDRLQSLSWMIGDWIEEGPEAVSTSSCQWDESGNFLVWKYKVRDKNANASGGTTYIGWDPLTRQITSWVFDSEGGHGEATWSRLADDQWMAKTSGILSDGRTASATQYIKQLGANRASWTSLDRVAGGEPVPNISEYVLVRQPQHASVNGSSAPKAAVNAAKNARTGFASVAEQK